MWKCLLCNTRATTNMVKHSSTEHHKATVREIEKRKKSNEQTSNSLKAGLTKNLQMETDDSEGEDQISTDVNYFSNPNESDSDSVSDYNAESINSSELSSEFHDSLSDISEEMESSTDTMFETNIEDDVLGDSEDWSSILENSSVS
ncbi:hypothetical protein BY996DRAFT_6484056 [Phakopsora pachyrhizi]|nr:hypothetical protein BY996DRAFT_6484056 [Phakopsora pachyrhizi]